MRASFVIISIFLIFAVFSIVEISNAAEYNNVVQFNTEQPSLPEYARVSLNINCDISTVEKDGHTLSDSLCKNGEFSIKTSNCVGEWILLGGAMNTPPVYFVDNLQNTVNLIRSKFRSEECIGGRPSAGGGCYGSVKFPEGYVDPETGIPVYSFRPTGGGAGVGYGNVICQVIQKSNFVEGANEVTKNSFVVTDSQNVNVKIENDVYCVFYRYVNGPLLRRGIFYPNVESCTLASVGYRRYRDCSNTLYSGSFIGSVNFVKSFTVEDPQSPKLEASAVSLDSQYTYGVPSLVTVNVNNIDNTEITITGATLNMMSSLISCYPSKISSGKSASCVFSILPFENVDASANLMYNLNQCGFRKFETKSISIGRLTVPEPQCRSDFDCNEGFTCCVGACSFKTLGVCRDINGDGINEWIPLAK